MEVPHLDRCDDPASIHPSGKGRGRSVTDPLARCWRNEAVEFLLPETLEPAPAPCPSVLIPEPRPVSAGRDPESLRRRSQGEGEGFIEAGRLTGLVSVLEPSIHLPDELADVGGRSEGYLDRAVRATGELLDARPPVGSIHQHGQRLLGPHDRKRHVGERPFGRHE